jgi:hypothetical protein
MLSHDYKISSEKGVFDNLVTHMSDKLKLKTGENDCVVLYTSVTYKDTDNKQRSKALSMIKLGDSQDSAMA